MLFSSKDKKTNSSKMLTEAEIKRKLYGEYETVSGGSHSAAHEVKMTGPAFESQAVKKPAVDINTRSHAAVSALGAGVKPQLAPRPSFSNSRSNDKAKVVSPQGGWKQVLLKSGRTALGVIAGVLWKIGSYLVKALDFVLRILDPRKPQARRLLYSITACILVAALFIGVFRLNSQRKKAMLGELPAVSVAAPAVSSVSSAASAQENVSPLSGSSNDSAVVADSSQREESQEMILKALENSSVSVPSTSSPVSESVTAPAAVGGKYVIQVATYAVLEDANRIIQNLKQSGFESFYKKQVRNSTGHSFFTVCLGRFESYSSAQESLATFRKASVARPFQDAFIRTMEP